MRAPAIRFDSLVHASADGSWQQRPAPHASEARLLRELDIAGADRACLVAIADVVANEVVAAIHRRHPDRFVPIASTHPCRATGAKAVLRAVAEIADAGFAGLKLHPRLGGYDPLDERCLAAIEAAGDRGLPVFLDTLFRQPGRATRAAADVVDAIVNACPGTRIVLLHGGGSSVLDLFELVRMHASLLLDVSFTLLRYEGSSVDLDLAFLCRGLDQRLVAGSDFPDYTPSQAFAKLERLTADLPEAKRERIFGGNLEALFADWKGMAR